MIVTVPLLNMFILICVRVILRRAPKRQCVMVKEFHEEPQRNTGFRSIVDAKDDMWTWSIVVSPLK